MQSYIPDTFSLTQYSYEVDELPRLTSEETAALGQRILLAHQGQIHQTEGMAARDAIIHGHLHLVLSLAQRYPYDVREDLIQEGNIGLIDAVEHYQFRDGCDFTSYAIVAIRHAFANAMESVLPIRIPRSSMRTAKAAGTADRLYAMQPSNLDRPYDTELYLADTIAAPEPRPQEEHTHASPVDTLLETLPDTVRVVLELRFGLDEEDQREHTYEQIAQTLGITRPGVRKMERRGLSILQGKQVQREELQRMAQESRLNAAYALFSQQGHRISSRQLARAAKVSDEIASGYLLRIKEKAEVKLGEKAYTRLQHAYCQLQEQQVKVTVLALQKAAGGNWNTAKRFLDYQAQLATQTLEQTDVCGEAVEA